ncbi:MAG: type IV secretion system DNA-binding domain-containing protein [Pegethrix bostrychoides GSE-TBD4-15B]|jgi:hypothetical protein|uniref:Type IV secretion system DNA-binding domain-containing protein n=1 Tax=Pegethrix bostrychoides GSE-TBD4-15B TaxID=2839662 RepID=A0A951P9L6_9CYAN|nr:type IV secretion system DNA-binding domain-containing protein [Pegethrix bostrychoides GSE-TBD4-15B]
MKSLMVWIETLFRGIFTDWVVEFKDSTDVTGVVDEILADGQKQLKAQRAAEKKRALEASNTPTLSLPSVKDGCIYFGDKAYPIDSIQGFFGFLGITGSGKTKLIKIMLGSILRLMTQESKIGTLLFDLKGDLHEVIVASGKPYKFFCLGDARSCVWDIAKDCTTPNRAFQLVSILLPEQKASDMFWQNGARAIAIGILLVFMFKHGDDWGFDDFVNAAFLDREEMKRFLLRFEGNKPLVNMLFQAEDNRVTQGILSQLYSQIKAIEPAAAHTQQGKSRFSIGEFLSSNERYNLILSTEQTAEEASTSILRAIFRSFVDHVSDLPDDPEQTTFLILEESYFLGKMPGLDRLFSFARSKNVIGLLALQAKEGFDELYGAKISNLILGMFYYIAVLKSTPETAKYISSLFGTKEYFDTTSSISFGQGGASGGTQGQRYQRLEYLDSEFTNLPLPSRETGMEGYFVTPKDMCRKNIRGEVIEYLQPPTVKVQKYIPLPAECQVLRLWSENEKRKYILGEEQVEEKETVYIPKTYEEVIGVEVFNFFADVIEQFFEGYKGED